jgi:hypothetical protein
LLVVAEVGSVVLLVGAGLLIRTFMYLEPLPAGFDPECRRSARSNRAIRGNMNDQLFAIA